MKIVLKLGGHLFFGDQINTQLIRGYASLIGELHKAGDRWVVVVGGGEVARSFVKAARELGADEAACDELAIKVTRANATLLVHALREVAEEVIPTTLEELRLLASRGKVVVTGGFQPGQSTMAVSALAASAIQAERMVVATDVDGIYTVDPKKHPDARPIARMGYGELWSMLGGFAQRAGEYPVMDAVGLAMLERIRVPVYYVNGFKLDSVREAVLGRSAGTIVSG